MLGDSSWAASRAAISERERVSHSHGNAGRAGEDEQVGDGERCDVVMYFLC